MKESVREKLDQLSMRLEELHGLLSDPDIVGDQNRFRFGIANEPTQFVASLLILGHEVRTLQRWEGKRQSA